ncbi:MAG: S-layer protein, partial [Candidatus Micrarchaeia archaeon]
MKTLNIKRITALAAGAALLGLGLAFAGPISFNNVPIINNLGQPQVQIVIGSAAQPSDGVAAGNIAAAIGNLAYKTVSVTASVNATQAQSVLSVTVPSSSYTISNPQVWLNLSSSSTISGAYQFQALIGSVLNRGVTTGQPSYTKSLQNSSSNYAYPNPGAGKYVLNSFPMDSPYT